MTSNMQVYKLYIEDLPKRVRHAELMKLFANYDSNLMIALFNKPRSKYVRAEITTQSWFAYQRLQGAKYKLHGRHIICESQDTISNRYLEENKRVYVINIPQSMSDEELSYVFSYFGEIEYAYVVRKGKENSRGKNYGFVKYRVQESADYVIRIKNIYLENEEAIICQEFNKENSQKPSAIKQSNLQRIDSTQSKNEKITSQKASLLLLNAELNHSNKNLRLNKH